MRIMLIIILSLFSMSIISQEISNTDTLDQLNKFMFGARGGAGWAYEDEAHLFNIAAGVTIDYRIKNNFFIQFAPKYSWLWKWNEHYLTLPLHLRKKIRNKLSLFAGPALTFDVGYFKDIGISGGAYYHFTKRSALVVSVYTFMLYDYDIDFLYIPVSITYHLVIF